MTAPISPLFTGAASGVVGTAEWNLGIHLADDLV